MYISNMMNGIDIKMYEKKDSILFNSHSKLNTRVLSNFYPCKIKYKGIIFNSSEQLYYWLLLEGNDLARVLILDCEDARKVKVFGKKILKEMGWDKSNEDCQRAEVQALRIAIGAKMECCEEFRVLVMTSGSKKIVEYAWWGDDEWGCVDVDERYKYDWNNGVLRGQNICGRLIMEWRKKWIAMADAA